MLRQIRAFATSFIVVFGITTLAAAQTTPSTAYQRDGKWVGYVPTHQKSPQPATGSVFRSSIPDITACLRAKSDDEVKPAAATEPAESNPDGKFGGTLLDSAGTDKEPRVLSVGFDEPTPAFDPMVEGEPVMAVPEMMGDACTPECSPCAAAPCCPPTRFYGSGEYLLWWIDGMGTPPLVTTSPSGTVQDEAGVLGQPGTSILFGGSNLEMDGSSGGRFSLGMWLDPCHSRGVEASYFTLGTQTMTYGASGSDYDILARPIYNTVDGAQDARLLVYDSLVTGSVNVTASTKFDGGEILFRQGLQRDCWADIDLLVGYRWMQLDDGLLIDESTQSLAATTAGTSFDLFDRFDTTNTFSGAQVGMCFQGQLTRFWSMELLAKVGIGNLKSGVTIDGETITVASTGTTVSEGGLLAQPTNMGYYERDSLSTATEVGLKLKRAFGNGIDFTVGYTFLYLSDVLRAGDQIDTDINVTQLSGGTLEGAAFPEFDFRSTGFWAQGLSIGIEGRY